MAYQCKALSADTIDSIVKEYPVPYSQIKVILKNIKLKDETKKRIAEYYTMFNFFFKSEVHALILASSVKSEVHALILAFSGTTGSREIRCLEVCHCSSIWHFFKYTNVLPSKI
jgi:hypothetical protein